MSPSATHQAAGAPASQPVFPDEILEDIFLRLDAAEDLARASAACTTFRRVVSARHFLHRFRCLHPQPVLGVVYFSDEVFHPAEPPHRSTPAARALAQAADFTFSFLDNPEHWMVADARDSRVLLYRLTSTASFADIVVCDPLHRRHVQLPTIPDDLAAANGVSGMQQFERFLDPDTDKDKEKQDLSFGVICIVHCQDKLVTFHFSSVTGEWRGMMFNLNTIVPLYSSLVEHNSPEMFKRYYAHGCYFWTMGVTTSFMIMLNMHDMELSVVYLHPGIRESPEALAVVEAGEGMIGLFTLRDNRLKLYYKSLRGTEWRRKRTIPLPNLNCYWSIVQSAAGYLLLKASPLNFSQFAMRSSKYFTLNLKTFLVEELCASDSHYTSGVFLYASFVSPFSLPSI